MSSKPVATPDATATDGATTGATGPEEQEKLTQQMWQMVSGCGVLPAIKAVLALGIADQLPDGVSLPATELATRTGSSAPHLFRLLRLLAAYGLVVHKEDGTWSLTPLGHMLRTDHPSHFHGIWGIFTMGCHEAGWLNITEAVKQGRSGVRIGLGEPVFEYLAHNQEELAVFNVAMSCTSAAQAPLVSSSFNFNKFRKVVDLGGGHGYLLKTVLQQHKGPEGYVLDLAHVVSTAPKLPKELEGRVHYQAADFFAPLDIKADCFLLKQILHDWSDEDCIKILRNVSSALEPGGRVIVVDTVVPATAGLAPDAAAAALHSVWMDVNMLVMTEGGKERSIEEWTTLFAAVGLELEEVIETKLEPLIVAKARE